MQQVLKRHIVVLDLLKQKQRQKIQAARDELLAKEQAAQAKALAQALAQAQTEAQAQAQALALTANNNTKTKTKTTEQKDTTTHPVPSASHTSHHLPPRMHRRILSGRPSNVGSQLYAIKSIWNSIQIQVQIFLCEHLLVCHPSLFYLCFNISVFMCICVCIGVCIVCMCYMCLSE